MRRLHEIQRRKKITEIFKKSYVEGLNSIIQERQKRAETIRKENIKDVFNHQEKTSRQF